jgi:hypothetical protein
LSLPPAESELRMEESHLRAVPDESRVETSPLALARVRRRLTIQEAAARTGLDPEDLRCLEEGRIYRFPSVNNALAAALVYATALGVSRNEARRIAGLPSRTERSSRRRWIGIFGFAGMRPSLRRRRSLGSFRLRGRSASTSTTARRYRTRPRASRTRLAAHSHTGSERSTMPSASTTP